MAVMMSIKVHGEGLLDYAKAGKDAVAEIRVGMRKVLNVGRTEARQPIAGQFACAPGSSIETRGTFRRVPRSRRRSSRAMCGPFQD